MEGQNKLTEKQIENWRKILSMSLGPYAFIMPVEQIEKIKDNFQKHACVPEEKGKGEDCVSEKH